MSVFDALGRHDRPEGLHWHDPAEAHRVHKATTIADPWVDVLAMAAQRGLRVTRSAGWVQIGQSSFEDHEGGAADARQNIHRIAR